MKINKFYSFYIYIFLYILIPVKFLDNENNIDDEIIEILEKNNLKIYQTINILKEYNINLYIINIYFFFDFIKQIPENSKIILLLNLNQVDTLNIILVNK